MLLEEIRRNSAALGARPALVSGEERITWGELWPRAESLAARLRAGGEGPVAVEGVRGAWVGAAFLACLIAGRPYLPLDPALPALRRTALLRRTRAQPLSREEAQRGLYAEERCPPAEDPERFPALTLLNAYGPTEATCAVCAARITREMCTGPLPIGAVGDGAAEVSLEDGEIILRGESVAPAYGGVYRTGDLGYVQNGLLYWNGRRDDQVKYKGYRIEPAEIERELEALPGVERAAVLPRLDAAGQVRGLTAFLEGRDLPDGAELSPLAAARLPRYLLPTQWLCMERLPLTANGKCDRNRLREMLE